MIARRGFTLIELLVVVAIIAVLTSLALVSMSAVFNYSRSLQCRSAQRQLFMGLQAYALDWRGAVAPAVMPQPGGAADFFWFLTIAPYCAQENATTHQALQTTNNVSWACQTWGKLMGNKNVYTSRTRPGIGMSGNLGLPDTTRSWNTNWTLPSGLTARNVKWSELTQTSQRVLLGDAYWAGLEARIIGGKATWYPVADASRHQGRANYTFCDGHVAALLPTGGTGYAYLDPSRYDL